MRERTIFFGGVAQFFHLLGIFCKFGDSNVKTLIVMEKSNVPSREFCAKVVMALILVALTAAMIVTFTEAYGEPNFWVYLLFACALSGCERFVGPLLFFFFNCKSSYKSLEWSDFKWGKSK